MTKRFAVAVILVVALAATCLAGGENLAWNQSLGGDFEPGADGTRLLAGRFISVERSSVAVWKKDSSPGFALLALTGSGWTGKLSFDVGGVNFADTPWLAADVDGDGLDELLFFPPGDMFRVDVREAGTLAASYGGYPESTVSAAALNIDSDPSEELVLLYHDPGGENPDGATPLWAGIWDFDESGCSFIWSDEGALGFEDPGFCPSDSITCAGNPLNSGEPTVLVWRSQSDVSPSLYDALVVRSGELARVDAFSITGGKVTPGDIYEETPPFAVANLQPLKMDGETLLLVSMVGEGYSFSKNAVLLKDGVFTDMGPVAEMDPADMFFPFDATGEQAGVLRLSTDWQAGRTEYVYYVAKNEDAAKDTGWKKFEAADFTMDIPPGARVSTGENGVRIDLPRTPGTMLDERSATVSVTEAGSEADCLSGIPEGNSLSVAGLCFRVLPGTKWEADMGGKRYYMAEYGTLAGDRCVRITFRMLMRDLTGFTDDPPRPAPPESETDTAVFDQMLRSFRLIE